MTPLQIQMMLHFHCSPDAFQPWSPAASEAMAWFREQGLVQEPVNLDSVRLSPRGTAYVHFLQALPLPTEMWSIPGPWNPCLPGDTLRERA